MARQSQVLPLVERIGEGAAEAAEEVLMSLGWPWLIEVRKL